MAMAKGVVMVMMLVFVIIGYTKANMDCGMVASKLAPCVSYLQGATNVNPTTNGCCDGVRSLNSMASTVSDRQAACKCMKQQMSTINPKSEYVSALPHSCGINLGYSISTSIDCSTVH